MLLTLLLVISGLTAQQLRPSEAVVHREVVYRVVGDWRGTVDVHVPSGARTMRPALVYFHGGEWTGGNRASASAHLRPYLARGFVVINVSYRLARLSPAPAAASDARCVFHWVINHATQYGIDASRVVLSGHSAGGHLALIAAYAPAGMLDRDCVRSAGRPAAVIGWNAPSDLGDLLRRRLSDGDPVRWLEDAEDPLRTARLLSPVRHVRPTVPPTLSVHATRDPEIPYAEAGALHHALRRRGVRQELVALDSSGHMTTDHPQVEVERAYQRIWRFLAWIRVMRPSGLPSRAAAPI